MLLNRTGNYVSMMPEDESNAEMTIVKIPGWNLAPLFNEWENKVFALFLEQFWKKWGISSDEIFQEPDCVRTYLN
jgi:hypothetical protein